MGLKIGQPGQVRHQLGMDHHAVRQFGPAAVAQIGDEGADHFLDALVYIGAIECGDAGVDEGLHVGDGLRGIDRAVIAAQLPAALEDARHPVAGAQLGVFDAHFCGSCQ